MATSLFTTTSNSLALPLRQFSCKSFSTLYPHNSHAFSSTNCGIILPTQFSPFFLVKPPLNLVHTTTPLCCLKDTETLDFRDNKSNLASGYSSYDSNCKRNDKVLKGNVVGSEKSEKNDRIFKGNVVDSEKSEKNDRIFRGNVVVSEKSEKNDRIFRGNVVDSEKSEKNGARINLGRGYEGRRNGRKNEEFDGGHASKEEFDGGNGRKNGGRSDGGGRRSKKGSGFSSLSNSVNDRGRRRMEEILGSVALNNDDHGRRGYNSQSRAQIWTKDGNVENIGNGNVQRKKNNRDCNSSGNDSKVKKKEKMSKKRKVDSPEFQLRVGLDMCSKIGDVMGAIALYDSAVKKGVKIGQHQYTVLLYLCSSAAMGIIRPAKSGSGSRSLNEVSSQEFEEDEEEDDDVDEYDSDDMDEEDSGAKEQSERSEVNEIRVSDEVKKYALERGFEIYERMCLDRVQMNEASMTSVARMAMSMGNGELAFDMVNQMKSVGISPKLRSYGPALSVFSSSGDVDKSFAVEEHMLGNGIQPEEPELEALLRVSIDTGKADRVYYVLHKLRAKVRSVSPSVADLIEKWFKSKEASRVGKRKWDDSLLAQTMESVGGGWHGQGWLGRGKWSVSRTSVGADGLCKCCGEKMSLIDLDPEETERFAESVASIAIKREKNSSFQKFQRWLEYYGPFEAVVDAANVGLFSQRRFKPSKVNVVVNGIRQTLPSKKWPLIILHNKRVTGSKMDLPINRAVVERWKNADALYATPTGSNDDWYWLYAAIKFKCLLVTNDEMRDHTFQLLGNDFFAKWKERHQVRFSFSEIGPVFHMPPPCSVVIQESVWGHWHVPLVSEHQSEGDRIWLCITRPKMLVRQHGSQDETSSGEDSKEELEDKKQSRTLNSESYCQAKTPLVFQNKGNSKELMSKGRRDVRISLSETMSANSDHICVWKAIEASENLGGCTIDFQI